MENTRCSVKKTPSRTDFWDSALERDSWTGNTSEGWQRGNFNGALGEFRLPDVVDWKAGEKKLKESKRYSPEMLNAEYSRFLKVINSGMYKDVAKTPEEKRDLARCLSVRNVRDRLAGLDFIDQYLDNGEGTVERSRVLDFEYEGVPFWDGANIRVELKEGIYRWVHIVQPRGKGEQVIATVYLVDYMGYGVETTQGMYLARVRKGLPPNPGDKLPGGYQQVSGTPMAFLDSQILPDPQGSQDVEGVRAVQLVRIEHRSDHDHMWLFPGFKVRSTKLAWVLWKFRDSGRQYVDVTQIQMALKYS